MMWAAAVRRCPSGPSRHPSQFGARLQLAKALNHAPYLIFDSVYNTGSQRQYSAEISRSEQDYVVDLPVENDNSEVQNIPRDGVRVKLPYSRRIVRDDDYYVPGQHVIRRYENVELSRVEPSTEDSVVSLSYQQQSLTGGRIYDREIWGSDIFIDCWSKSPYYLEEGVLREFIKTVFVIGVSLTLIVLIIITSFGVHNMIIMGLFLALILLTVVMAIFLLIKKPAVSSQYNTDSSSIQQREIENNQRRFDINKKKKLSDSPPPYEYPPDYDTLPPEVLMSASDLQLSTELASVHERKPSVKRSLSAANSPVKKLATACRYIPFTISSSISHIDKKLDKEEKSTTKVDIEPPPYHCVINIPTDAHKDQKV